MIDREWQHIESLLLVRLDSLGDVLVTTPAIYSLRAAFPDAAIYVAVPRSVGAQAARLNPDIDDVIVYEAPWMDPWGTLRRIPEREQRLLDEIAGAHFDAAVIFTSFRQSSLPAAYLCYLAGIPLRLGASLDGSGSLLTLRHKHDSDSTQNFPHEVKRSLDLISAIGVEQLDSPLILEVPEAGRKIATDVVSGFSAGGPLIVVHPGCSMPARTYPAEGFRDAVALLVKGIDARIVVTGVESERELASFVAGDADPGSVISVAGRLPSKACAASSKPPTLPCAATPGLCMCRPLSGLQL